MACTGPKSSQHQADKFTARRSGPKLTQYIGDKLIPPLIGNPINGYILHPYYKVDEFDDHPLLYGNNGSLDLSKHIKHRFELRLVVSEDG